MLILMKFKNKIVLLMLCITLINQGSTVFAQDSEFNAKEYFKDYSDFNEN